MTEQRYVGRFAPSPTGPLHFGSLVAAVGSFLEARAHHGKWLLRIEDVDRPRSVPGAEEAIVRALAHFGFEWDGPVVCQRDRLADYGAVLERLRSLGRVFPCACSRRELADSSLARDGSLRYPGTCRDGLAPGRSARSLRLRVDSGVLTCFDDAVQGRQCEDVGAEVGDYVILRADGQYAYQLAVVVDDAAAGVSHVVRGADLLDSTCRQIVLQQVLGLPTPAYMHLPVATNAAGEKLSKQTLARALEEGAAAEMLVAALDFLGQAPPAELARESLAKIWSWARAHWRADSIPRCRSLAVAPRFWETRT